MGKADQEVGIVLVVENFINRTQDLRQRFRVQFGCSTSTVRITGQADLASCWMNS
jgi:hypothetical protein